MLRQMIAGIAAAATCLAGVTPALAQDYSQVGFDPPPGAAATLNLRVPLGRQANQDRPTLGLTLGYGRMVGGTAPDGRPAVRQLRLADLRLDGRGVSRAELASFDLLDLDEDRRLGIDVGGDKKNNMLLFFMILGGLTGMYFLIEGDSRGQRSRPEDTTPSPSDG